MKPAALRPMLLALAGPASAGPRPLTPLLGGVLCRRAHPARAFLLAIGGILALGAPPAASAPVTFGYTGAIVDYTVPDTGQYRITAVGARGGSVLSQGGTGGLGAQAAGTFSLLQGEVLRILVGAAGADNTATGTAATGYAGGGGGSFVVASDGRPLVVAGGGGGGGQLYASYPPDFQPVRGGARYNGGDALLGPDGGASAVPGDPVLAGGAGGTGGSDGEGGRYPATFNPSPVNAGRGFNSFPSGLGLGAFGGGGLADSFAGAGGGGGYSGGGGGGVADVFGTFRYGFGGGPGGGGGSFTAGADPLLLARIGTGNGSVTIAPLATPVPEPAGMALLGAGLGGLAALRRRR